MARGGRAFLSGHRAPGAKYINYNDPHVAPVLHQALKQAARTTKPSEQVAIARSEGFPVTSFRRKVAQFGRGEDIFAHSKRGRRTALGTTDEQRLATWVQECAVRGFPQFVSSIKLRAKQLLARAGGKFLTESKAGLPSDAWFKGFKTRFSFALKTPATLNRSRAKAEDPKVTRGFFANVVAVSKAKKILPDRWYGADETGFGEAKGKVKAKVVVPEGMGNPQMVSGDYFTQHLSLMVGMDTAGRYLCPMFIFKVRKPFAVVGDFTGFGRAKRLPPTYWRAHLLALCSLCLVGVCIKFFVSSRVNVRVGLD